jgi:hypothetical protein
MTKSELLTALNGKFYKVGAPNQQQIDEFGIQYYLVKVYDKVGDAIRDMNLAFYVEAEGQPSEAAYWSPSEPKPTPIESSRQKLLNYIESKITDGTIRAGYIEQADFISETVIIKVVMEIGGNTVEKRIFIDKDPQGNLRQEVLP